MKIKLIGKPEIIMHNPESKHNYFAWPSVARLKNGKIAAACSGFRLSHICPFGKVAMVTSEDEGESFSPIQIAMDTILDDRDAGLTPFGENGLILTSFNHSMEKLRNLCVGTDEQLKYMNAYMDMLTPEMEEGIQGSTYRVSYDNGKKFGKINLAPVTSPHGPTELSDGTILWVGRAYGDGNKGEYKDHIISCKTGLGGECEIIGKIEPVIIENGINAAHEPHAIELDNGTILCHFRVERTWDIFTLYQTESHDGGKTWTKPHQILDDLGGAPAHLLKLSSGAIVSTYGYRRDPVAVKAMISYDNGKTWDTDDNIIYTNPDFTDNFDTRMKRWDMGYPATVELNDGSLLTVFYIHPTEDAPPVIMKQKWSFEK